MSDLLILTAAEFETRALARHLELVAEPAYPFAVHRRAGVRVAAIGVGARHLGARFAGLLEGLRAPLVVSAGVCGALDPALRRGDLVLPRAVLGPAGVRAGVDAAAHALAGAGAWRAAAGALVSTSAVVTTPEAKAALRARTAAVAVDMESAAVLAAAARAGCPALVVRAVSDAADEGVPADLLPVLGADGRLSVGAALGLLGRPRVLPRAIALGRASSRALAAVAGALAALAARRADDTLA